MPDILIRGYSAPASCATCHFNSNAFCDVLGRKVKIPVDYVERPNTCPLVELPPHGDLVDATQYRDEFMDGVYNMCADDSDNNRANAIIDLYDCAPVVVPAERSDTDA